MRTLLCVCPPRVESLFPPVLSKSCNQIPLAFKVWFSRNSSSRCRTPRLGSLTWGSQPSLQWVDFCGISVLQFVNHLPSNYGIWFYCDCAPPTVSLWLLPCLWMWGIFFGEFQCLPVDDCSAVSCDSVLLQEGVGTRPSTPPPPNSLLVVLIIFLLSFTSQTVNVYFLFIYLFFSFQNSFLETCLLLLSPFYILPPPPTTWVFWEDIFSLNISFFGKW